jgi:hypothetical protein
MSNEAWVEVTRHPIGKRAIIASVRAGETNARFEVVQDDGARFRISAEDAVAIIKVNRPAGV